MYTLHQTWFTRTIPLDQMWAANQKEILLKRHYEKLSSKQLFRKQQITWQFLRTFFLYFDDVFFQCGLCCKEREIWKTKESSARSSMPSEDTQGIQPYCNIHGTVKVNTIIETKTWIGIPWNDHQPRCLGNSLGGWYNKHAFWRSLVLLRGKISVRPLSRRAFVLALTLLSKQQTVYSLPPSRLEWLPKLLESQGVCWVLMLNAPRHVQWRVRGCAGRVLWSRSSGNFVKILPDRGWPDQ